MLLFDFVLIVNFVYLEHRDKLSENYKERMDTFVKRMIQRPNKINPDYKNINDHDYKDDMGKDMKHSIVQFEDIP